MVTLVFFRSMLGEGPTVLGNLYSLRGDPDVRQTEMDETDRNIQRDRQAGRQAGRLAGRQAGRQAHLRSRDDPAVLIRQAATLAVIGEVAET